MNVKDVAEIFMKIRQECTPEELEAALLVKIVDILLLHELSSEGDKAEGESHRERLNPEGARDSVCDSPNTVHK